MSDLYCGKYNFGIITERNNRFWKLGRSHAPAARIKNTTGTLRSTPELVKVWKGKGHLEGRVLRSLGSVYGDKMQGEWVATKTSRRRFVRRVDRAIAAAERCASSAKRTVFRRGAAMALKKPIRRPRGLRRPRPTAA